MGLCSPQAEATFCCVSPGLSHGPWSIRRLKVAPPQMWVIVSLRISSTERTGQYEASLGCSVFSELYNASWPARMSTQCATDAQAAVMVGQRGVAQSCRTAAQFLTRDRAGEETAPRQLVCIPALGSIYKTISTRAWTVETLLPSVLSHGSPERFVHPNQVFVPFDCGTCFRTRSKCS